MAGCGAVPVPLIGGGVDDVASADLFDLAAAAENLLFCRWPGATQGDLADGKTPTGILATRTEASAGAAPKAEVPAFSSGEPPQPSPGRPR